MLLRIFRHLPRRDLTEVTRDSESKASRQNSRNIYTAFLVLKIRRPTRNPRDHGSFLQRPNQRLQHPRQQHSSIPLQDEIHPLPPVAPDLDMHNTNPGPARRPGRRRRPRAWRGGEAGGGREAGAAEGEDARRGEAGEEGVEGGEVG
ncbi:hypothetical protein VDGL01_05692 [Verticillium dahliae]